MYPTVHVLVFRDILENIGGGGVNPSFLAIPLQSLIVVDPPGSLQLTPL